MPLDIYQRIQQLVYTLPQKMGLQYMWSTEVQFHPPKCDYMNFLLTVHPFIFRTMSDVPDAAISEESLIEIVQDHLRKLDTQVHTYFNETNGEFWLKHEYQHMGYKSLSHCEPS